MNTSASFQTLFDLTDWINGVFLTTWRQDRTSQNTILGELRDGCLLIKLTNALLSMRLPTLYKEPYSVTERIANIELCLETLRDNGARLSGFLAKDIAEGDMEVVFAFGQALKREFSFRFWYPRRESAMLQDTIKENKTMHRPSALEKIQELQESVSGSNLETPCPSMKRPVTSPMSHQYTGDHFLFPQIHDIKGAPTTFNSSLSNFETPVCHSTPYEKMDIDLLSWLSSLLGTKINTFERLMDGRLLCQLVNILHPGSIPPKVVERSSASDRFYHAFRIANSEFGLQRNWEINGVQDLWTQDALRQFVRELYFLNMKREPRSVWRRGKKTHSILANDRLTDSASDITLTAKDHIADHNRTRTWSEEISAMIPDLGYQSSDLSLSCQELDAIERRGKIHLVERKLKGLQDKIDKFRAARQKLPKKELEQTLLQVRPLPSRVESKGLETSRIFCDASEESKETTSKPVPPELPKSLSLKLSDAPSSSETSSSDPTEEHHKAEQKQEEKEMSQHYKAAQAITALALMSSRRPQGAFKRHFKDAS